jgi:hypothetical protein
MKPSHRNFPEMPVTIRLRAFRAGRFQVRIKRPKLFKRIRIKKKSLPPSPLLSSLPSSQAQNYFIVSYINGKKKLLYG